MNKNPPVKSLSVLNRKLKIWVKPNARKHAVMSQIIPSSLFILGFHVSMSIPVKLIRKIWLNWLLAPCLEDHWLLLFWSLSFVAVRIGFRWPVRIVLGPVKEFLMGSMSPMPWKEEQNSPKPKTPDIPLIHQLMIQPQPTP